MEMKPEKGRMNYLDAAKGLGITMIVYGHIMTLSSPVSRYLAAYKITVFFVVSGFLIRETRALERYTLPAYFRRHLRSLMMPYALFSVFLAIYQAVKDFCLGHSLSQIVARVVGMGYKFLTLRGYSTLWFLPCLFLGQMLFFLIWKKDSSGRKTAALLLALGGALFIAELLKRLKGSLGEQGFKFVSYPLLTVGKALVAFCFIAAGYALSVLHKRMTRENLRFVLGILFLILPAILTRFYKGVDLNNLKLGTSPALFLIASVFGSFGAVLTLEGLARRLSLPYLTWAGKNSLVIMATHGTMGFKYMLYQGWLNAYGLAEKPGLVYYLQNVGILVCLMLLECGIVAIVNSYFPMFAGRSPVRKKRSES